MRCYFQYFTSVTGLSHVTQMFLWLEIILEVTHVDALGRKKKCCTARCFQEENVFSRYYNSLCNAHINYLDISLVFI